MMLSDVSDVCEQEDVSPQTPATLWSCPAGFKINILIVVSLFTLSSGKLAITTHPRHEPGSGPVVVETVQGGAGISSIHYHFVSQSPSVRLRVFGGGGGGVSDPQGSPSFARRKGRSPGTLLHTCIHVGSRRHMYRNMYIENTCTCTYL